MDDWALVKLAGMVEGYREKHLQGRRRKVAFFELEDLTGRVNVKVRAREIDSTRTSSTAGEPVLIDGQGELPAARRGRGRTSPRARASRRSC